MRRNPFTTRKTAEALEKWRAATGAVAVARHGWLPNRASFPATPGTGVTGGSLDSAPQDCSTERHCAG